MKTIIYKTITGKLEKIKVPAKDVLKEFVQATNRPKKSIVKIF